MVIKSHPERVSNLKNFESDYDWSGPSFPVTIKCIEDFEIKNNITVNVLAVEEEEIYIWRKSDYTREKEINLMLISEGDKRHYTVIKSLSRLLASRNSKRKCKQHFCTNCLQGFTH